MSVAFEMAGRIIVTFIIIICYANAAPNRNIVDVENSVLKKSKQPKEDLRTAASSYSRQYSDWGGRNPGGYSFSVTGHGIIDDTSRYNDRINYHGNYGSFSGYNSYQNSGYPGTSTFDDYGRYKDNVAYGQDSIEGNGGYGGFGGNGGLNSYSGYNNPYYRGSNHLGYGYYNKGYGNIYNNEITPSLVTGYRGYTK